MAANTIQWYKQVLSQNHCHCRWEWVNCKNKLNINHLSDLNLSCSCCFIAHFSINIWSRSKPQKHNAATRQEIKTGLQYFCSSHSATEVGKQLKRSPARWGYFQVGLQAPDAVTGFVNLVVENKLSVAHVLEERSFLGEPTCSTLVPGLGSDYLSEVLQEVFLSQNISEKFLLPTLFYTPEPSWANILLLNYYT